MRKILNTEFTNKYGILFVINENYNRNEYEGKYKLMWWLDSFGSWGRITTGNSLRELKAYALTIR